MTQVKICPTCGLQNPLTATMCNRCMADISAVNPIDPDAPAPQAAPQEASSASNEDPGATKVEKKKLLSFETPDGRVSFSISSGSELGREKEGKSHFSAYSTVSRRHARLMCGEADDWTIEDLASTNGTWVNERRLEPGEKCPIKAGDTVALSRSCILKVRE